MSRVDSVFFNGLYKQFESPITKFNCGYKCAPYNQKGVPFCCDTHHAIPTAYQSEWGYLKSHTNLWHLWNNSDFKHTNNLINLTPEGHVLIECLGHDKCQREYRSITCRSFPFFPYIDHNKSFIGLAYYWQYEDRCWILSNLQLITQQYLQEFIGAYQVLFDKFPEETENFRQYSIIMRRTFGRKKRAITIIHRNGNLYKLSPRNGRLRRLVYTDLQKFGPYKIAEKLPFLNEGIVHT